MPLLILFLLLSSTAFAVNNKVLICGVCKNVAHSLDNSIKNIEELGSHFADYRVIIYENNSQDDTAQRLKNWASSNPRVFVLSETLSDKMLALSRTVRIANARNKVLKVARKKKYRKFRHLIMADLDFKAAWPIKEIIETIRIPKGWDAIFANGIKGDGYYFDRLAYRSKEYPFGPELLDYEYWNELGPVGSGAWFRLKQDFWPKVYSAFGGLAIYKTKTICKFSYSGIVTKELKQYYKSCLASLPPHSPQLETYLRLTSQPPSNPAIRFRKNCLEWQSIEDNSIAVCEHVALHAAMALKGYDRFYINPKMIMNYD